jgi:stage II sporulation protein M
MNKLWHYIKDEVIKGKKLYLFLVITLLVGVIMGSIFITILDNQDKNLVANQLITFFKQIKGNHIDYLLALKNSLTSNLIYILFIWILGISIIGIPIIIFLVFMKGFVIGFSIAAIVMKYKLLGILGAITYITPHVIILAMVILIISCYALYMSFNLFWAIIKRKTINFKDIINRYIIILGLSILFIIITSLIEVFVSPYLIKFFLIFVKL